LLVKKKRNSGGSGRRPGVTERLVTAARESI